MFGDKLGLSDAVVLVFPLQENGKIQQKPYQQLRFSHNKQSAVRNVKLSEEASVMADIFHVLRRTTHRSDRRHQNNQF